MITEHRQLIFVISDLHLTRKNSKSTMCSSNSQKLLAEFIRWILSQKNEKCDVTLVLAGDIVDFLADSNLSNSFITDDNIATESLKQIVADTSEVWDALHDFVGSGAKLVMLIGNHDLELSLYGPRKFLMEKLGYGHFEFIYDNQAFSVGPILIEHGNRYDSWNAVPHDILRSFRSSLSRKEQVKVPKVRGSELVVRVINEIKQEYSFVDLLKPEMRGVLPLLVVLKPCVLKKVKTVAKIALATRTTGYSKERIPKDLSYISASSNTRLSESEKDEKILSLCEELAGMSEPDAISAGGDMKAFNSLWRAALSKGQKHKQLERLYKAFKELKEGMSFYLNVNNEKDDYLIPAKEAVQRGFKVIVYGHTHLPKRVKIDHDAVYLNTGTWADIMLIPKEVVSENKEQALSMLEAFVEDILANNLDSWRRHLPAFAQIELKNDAVTHSDIYLFYGMDNIKKIPDGGLWE